MTEKAKKQTILSALLIVVILIADQVLKIWVKTHMQIGEDIPLIGSWCRLHFVENEGMAFGMAFGGSVGKLMLSLFRVTASCAVMWCLVHFIKNGIRTSFVIALALIFVGAVGNLLDSCFYGMIFNESYYSLAQLFPPEGGYAPFLHGRVVDMLYFPIITSGNNVIFFDAIFNIADSAITIGCVLLIIDQIFLNRKDCPNDKKIEDMTPENGVEKSEM